MKRLTTFVFLLASMLFFSACGQAHRYIPSFNFELGVSWNRCDSTLTVTDTLYFPTDTTTIDRGD